MITTTDKEILEEKLFELNTKRSEIITNKKQYETKLSILKNEVRANLNKMSPDSYRTLCAEQDDIKRELMKIQLDIDKINKEIGEKRLRYEQVRNYLMNNEKEALPSTPVIEILKQLRTKYNQFAGDYTRVSSTRIMATKFVEDLDGILKKYK